MKLSNLTLTCKFEKLKFLNFRKTIKKKKETYAKTYVTKRNISFFQKSVQVLKVLDRNILQGQLFRSCKRQGRGKHFTVSVVVSDIG